MKMPLMARIAGLLFLSTLVMPALAQEGFRVPAPAAGQLDTVDSITIRRDYPGSIWLEGGPELGQRLSASGVPFEHFPLAGRIQVHDWLFDPLDQRLSLADAPRNSAGDGLALVQFHGPIQSPDLIGLRDHGLEPLQYYPHNAYLVWGSASALQAARTQLHVRSVHDFAPEFRLHPGLDDREGIIRNINVHFVNTGDADHVLDALTGLGANVLDAWKSQPDGRLWDAKIELDAAMVQSLTTLPQVVSANFMSPEVFLDDESGAQVVAGNLDGNNIPAPGYGLWLDEIELDGSGVTWAVTDSGIWYDHGDYQGRIVGGHNYPGCNTSNPGDDPTSGGHGTHVAGIMGGDGTAAFTDSDGFLYGLGVAPGVSLFAQNPICGSQASWPPAGGWPVLSRDALAGGAIGSNNSWTSGEGTQHGYQNSERTYDIMVLDGNFDSEPMEPFTVVFSAGNSGQSGITAPKEAKNVIVTGSTQTYRASGDVDAISGTSSRGPAVDGRVLPTIMAPGGSVSSTRRPGASTCATSISGTSGEYAFCSGTSMAAPHASGALVLLSEWWRNLNDGQDFSPAMARALLINGARALSGSDGPNNNSGFGSVDLSKLLGGDTGFEFWDEGTLLTESGQQWAQSIGVMDASQPLKITLVWSDAPGAVGANPAIVNDLDLIVENGGETFLGNVTNGTFSVPGGEPDRLHNIEQVWIENPGPDALVTVEAFQIPGSVILNDPEIDTAQHFALVCQNCFLGDPTFSLSVAPNSAEACVTDNDGVDFLASVGPVGDYQGTVSLSTDGLPAGVAAGFDPVVVEVPGTADASLSIDETVATEGIYPFHVVGTDGTATVEREFILSLNEPLITGPVALTPPDGASDTSLTPTFSWTELDFVDEYRIQIATDENFASVIVDETVADTAFVPADDLALDTGYFFRIAGVNFCGEGPWSAPSAFSTRLEPVADFSATEYSFQLEVGETDSAELELSNTGTGNLVWTIDTDTLEHAETIRGGVDPEREEELALAAFSLPGSGTHTTTATAGVTTVGTVVGFSFEGTVAGVSGNATWASDMVMTITSPDGASYSVGGYQTGNPDWDFQGSASNSDGTYQSSHIGSGIFGEDGTPDAGEWTFEFVHTYNDTMNWSDVTVTLHKVAPPFCEGKLNPPVWLSASPTSGSIGEGDTQIIGIDVDSSMLFGGDFTGYLCVATNDPDAELVPIEVTLSLLDGADGPIAQITPEELVFDLETDPAGTADLSIRNIGAGSLEWSLETAPESCDDPGPVGWLNIAETSGTNSSGQTSLVAVAVDDTGLGPMASAMICVTTNDPDQLAVDVPVTLFGADELFKDRFETLEAAP